jgi:hypothetical protein
VYLCIVCGRTQPHLCPLPLHWRELFASSPVQGQMNADWL